ncbi:MAG: hypothetical protein ACM359_12020, partial [Bacillota bacterium]
GGRKRIWITEFAYYGTDDLPRRPFIPQANAWAEQRLLENERQCADYTVRFFVLMLSRGVQKVFIHSGSSGAINEPEFECPLFAYGATPRKLAPALATLTGLLGPAPSYVGERRLGNSGYCVAFETGRSSVLVLWQTEDSTAISIAAPATKDVSWLDTVGRTLTSPPSPLSSSPVYLIGQSGQAKDLLQTIQPVRDRQ